MKTHYDYSYGHTLCGIIIDNRTKIVDNIIDTNCLRCLKRFTDKKIEFVEFVEFVNNVKRGKRRRK